MKNSHAKQNRHVPLKKCFSGIVFIIMPDVVKEALKIKVIHAVNNNAVGSDVVDQISVASEIAESCFSLSSAFKQEYGLFLADTHVVGLFVDNLPEFTGIAKHALHRYLSLVLGSPFGKPFQYNEQHNGTLIPLLKPRKGSVRNTNSSRGDFGPHTDDAYFMAKYRTSFISLLGMVNEASTSTGYSTIADIAEQLSDQELKILQQPIYQFRLPFSFKTDSKNKWSKNKPIIYYDEQGVMSVQCPVYNTRIDPDCKLGAQRVFEKFKGLVEETVNWVTVNPGCYFIFKNDKGLHQRKAISGDRAIFRAYWHTDLACLAEKTGTSGFVFSLAKLGDDSSADTSKENK